ncbi:MULTISPECIES: hypothetical protein [unclassified Pseudoalteromonas]|uniref:hypothetical protein n=1 Tax=unclassified Pseudoalteromonas TaxID=194690 RepID=UPI0020978347|nr:hypothetical protein [Pseudoalteromonas sp. XMcav2-N]MCO7188382.1 hypothetical protein [Pseudoalteromonas sp. XMcav2-N]
MFWKIMFWATALLLIVPLPFKVGALVLGRDTRSPLVIIEELSNAVFLGIGLIAFWQYAYTNGISNSPQLWNGWLFIAIAWSILAVFKSPKLSYAQEKIGKTTTVAVSVLSTIFFLPMFVAVFNYAN